MGAPAGFAPTRWSVLAGLAGSDGPASARALIWICETYWQPLVAHAQRRGWSLEQAQDLVQGFFTRVLEHRDLRPDRSRGRFRSYLLTALDHFLANAAAQAHAQKRGGGQAPAPLTAAAGAAAPPAEDAFTRDWAEVLLAQGLAGLAQEARTPTQLALHRGLRPFLTRPPAPGELAPVAQALAMSEGALRVALHRQRTRLGELLRAEVARTLGLAPEDGEVDDELAALVAALRHRVAPLDPAPDRPARPPGPL